MPDRPSELALSTAEDLRSHVDTCLRLQRWVFGGLFTLSIVMVGSWITMSNQVSKSGIQIEGLTKALDLEYQSRKDWQVNIESSVSALHLLQVTSGQLDQRINALKNDQETQRNALAAFQNEIRLAIVQSQNDAKISNAQVNEILTGLRIKLGDTKIR